jgi:hypothetical protein
MKIRISKEHAGVLLVALTTGAILGITLGSYLTYTTTQARSVMHSQAWNAAIPVAEAGVEDALAHINCSVIGTNFAVNGWTIVSNQFQMSNRIDGGRYITRISRDRWPIITSVGYTKDGRSTNEMKRTVQVTTTQYATGMKGIVAKGDVTMTGITSMDSFDSQDPRYSTEGHYDPAKHKDGGYTASVTGNVYAETVYGSVGTGPTGTATGAVGDFAWVDGGNTGIQPGKYVNDVNLAFPVVQPPWSGGASPVTGTGRMLTLTNFQYWSTVVTTPYIPTNPPPTSPIITNYIGVYTIAYPGYPPPSIAPNLIVTNTLDVVEKKSNPDPAPGSYVGLVVEKAQYRYYSAITGYTYPTLTYSYSLTATNASTIEQAYSHVLDQRDGKYETINLRLSGGDKLLVLNTNVTLYITGDFSMVGSSELIIAPGCSLRIYVGGNVSLAGSGIFNYTSDASAFSLFGLPGCTDLAISGNASFTGVVYAPNANITLNGSGSTIYDVVGALVGKTATVNGHFQFHYDEALGRARIISKYNVASWREL